MKISELKRLIKSIIKEVRAQRMFSSLEEEDCKECGQVEEIHSDSLEISSPKVSNHITEKNRTKKIMKEERSKLFSFNHIKEDIEKELKKCNGFLLETNSGSDVLYINDGFGGSKFSGRITIISENCFNIYLMKGDMYLREINTSLDRVKEYIKILGENLDGGRWKLFLDRKEILVNQSNLSEDKMKESAKTTIFTVKSPKYSVEPKKESVKTKEVTCCRNMKTVSNIESSFKKPIDNKHPKQASGKAAKKTMSVGTDGEVKKKKSHTVK